MITKERESVRVWRTFEQECEERIIYALRHDDQIYLDAVQRILEEARCA